MSVLNKNDLSIWLQQWLHDEKLTDIDCKILDNSNSGEGCTGDMTFLQIKGKRNSLEKEYHLALKFSTNIYIKPMYVNEICFYEHVLPEFIKLHQELSVGNQFFKIPQYYGSVVEETRLVIALEDLSHNGYKMCDKLKPLSRIHIDLVLEEYAKIHATSLALKIRSPEKFSALSELIFREFKNAKKTDQVEGILKSFGSAFSTVAQVLENHLDEGVLQRWRRFGEVEVKRLFEHEFTDKEGLNVFTHNDCWNNNYMFRQVNSTLDLVILDWQLIRLMSPCADIANFLFCCISENDIKDLDDILDHYHKHFVNCLKILKVDPETYPKKTFLKEWKSYSKYGIVKVPITLQVCYLDEKAIDDLKERGETGDFGNMFSFQNANESGLRKRLKHVIQYIVDHNLI